MEPLQAWIAEVLESQASWRRSKAEEYPDDLRNARSAAMLEEVAESVRELEDPDASPGMRGFSAFDAMVEAPELESLVHAGYRTGRFGFDNTAKPADFEEALSDLLDDSIESWADYLGDGGKDQPRSAELVQFFKDAGFPLWHDEDEEADDA